MLLPKRSMRGEFVCVITSASVKPSFLYCYLMYSYFENSLQTATSASGVSILCLELSLDLALPNRLNKCPIVQAVLLGVLHGKLPDGLIKTFACSKVAGNHGWVA